MPADLTGARLPRHGAIIIGDAHSVMFGNAIGMVEASRRFHVVPAVGSCSITDAADFALWTA